ncbi:MAG: acetyl-CoA hydrolase/transferase C-terminal domain-containing protein [bacterium]|nr:acetyl-CoA hydrolase/transferase C-terminal domain-containing protein [bacterium]
MEIPAPSPLGSPAQTGPFAADYARRLMPAAQAAGLISSQAKVVMGLGIAQPPALLKALADRASAADIDGIRLYYLLSTAIAGDTVLQHALRDRIRPMSLFHGAIERELDRQAAAAGLLPVDFLPTAFSQSPKLLCEQVDADVLLTTVSPMDASGHFSFGTNTDYALAVSRSARQVIVEVNPAMPRLAGNCTIHVSHIAAIVEHATPLLEIAPVALRPEDEAIGQIIAALADDGACLQMGIGAVPQAVCGALQGHRHLGIHTELMTPALAVLMQAGVIDNSRKSLHPGQSVFTFAMGDRALYDFLDGHEAMAAYPVDYVNDPAIIARNDRMFSVNATLQVDLQGACNSESIGAQQYSAAGGQLDFVRGASASAGGRSIIACHSTAAKGRISRIVPCLNGAVTTPRNDSQIIVTEYGWADMKGKTLRERAAALIALAHPDFREQLERAAYATA